jgi:hypothetical protein
MSPAVTERVTRTLLLVVLASGLVAGPVGAGSSKSADVRLDFLQTTDGCQPTATVTWNGYRVQRFGTHATTFAGGGQATVLPARAPCRSARRGIPVPGGRPGRTDGGGTVTLAGLHLSDP